MPGEAPGRARFPTNRAVRGRRMPAFRASSATVSRLPSAEFQHRDAGPGQQAGKVRDQAPIGRIAIRATIQRDCVARSRATSGIRAVRSGGGDVGRIAQDEIEACRPARRPSRRRGTRRGRQAQRGGIARGQGGGGGRAIHADAERGGEFGQRREQQAAGAGAEIEHAARRSAARRMPPAPPRSVSRNSGRGISVAGETAKSRLQNSRWPRISASGSCATRRAQQAARSACRIDGRGAIAQQSGRRDAERVGQQQPCVESRIVDAGRAQARRRPG